MTHVREPSHHDLGEARDCLCARERILGEIAAFGLPCSERATWCAR